MTETDDFSVTHIPDVPIGQDIEDDEMPKKDQEEEAKEEEEDPERIDEALAQQEAQSRAEVLEMIGDLPFAEIKPPENVLFVCKLNPVTQEEDLEIIFSRFGKILSCEIIRDHKTGDSLCYAFIEFQTQHACEEAYCKMDNVLIDDRRIRVDFSQSVAKLHHQYWQNKVRKQRGQNPISNQRSNNFPNSGLQMVNRNKSSSKSSYEMVFDTPTPLRNPPSTPQRTDYPKQEQRRYSQPHQNRDKTNFKGNRSSRWDIPASHVSHSKHQKLSDEPKKKDKTEKKEQKHNEKQKDKKKEKQADGKRHKKERDREQKREKTQNHESMSKEKMPTKRERSSVFEEPRERKISKTE